MTDRRTLSEAQRLQRAKKTPAMIRHKTVFFAGASVCRTSGAPVYGVSVRRLRYGFTPLGRARSPPLTAGFIWCGRPVLGFSVGFNIWSPLWAEEEGMLVDDWWLGADRRGRGGARGDGGRPTDGEWCGGSWKWTSLETSGFGGPEIKRENLFIDEYFYMSFIQREGGDKGVRLATYHPQQLDSIPNKNKTCSLLITPACGLWLDLMEISFNAADVNYTNQEYIFFVPICRSQVCIFPREHHIPSVHLESINADGSKNCYFIQGRDVFDENRCVILLKKYMCWWEYRNLII